MAVITWHEAIGAEKEKEYYRSVIEDYQGIRGFNTEGV